jgi:hypothetical protein
MLVETYGPSLHVKTCRKPQDRTSDSASLRDWAFVFVDIFS